MAQHGLHVRLLNGLLVHETAGVVVWKIQEEGLFNARHAHRAARLGFAHLNARQAPQFFFLFGVQHAQVMFSFEAAR